MKKKSTCRRLGVKPCAQSVLFRKPPPGTALVSHAYFNDYKNKKIIIIMHYKINKGMHYSIIRMLVPMSRIKR